MSTEFKPVMPFYDQTHSFTHGFECGILWERMTNGEYIGGCMPVHTKNIPQIRLMCQHFGYEIIVKPYDEDWSFIETVTKNQQPKQAKG